MSLRMDFKICLACGGNENLDKALIQVTFKAKGTGAEFFADFTSRFAGIIFVVFAEFLQESSLYIDKFLQDI